MLFNMQYVLWVILPGVVLSGIAGWMTRSAFAKYSKVRVSNGLTGAQAAEVMLQKAGISDVKVVPTRGYLSDHYNPMSKSLALSEPVYSSSSISAIGVACHEAGHAIQHSRNYRPMWLRSALVPTAGIGSKVGLYAMMFGLAIGDWMVLIGAALFSMVLLFQLVTLPVEFDASNRAKRLAVENGIIRREERAGMDKVLNAAALTYVAAAASTLLTLLYFLMRAGLLGGRRD